MEPTDPGLLSFVEAKDKQPVSNPEDQHEAARIINGKTNLAMLSAGKFIPSRHLQRQSRTNLNLRSQKFRTIPIMLHLLLKLLPHRQLLLLRSLLIFLRHSRLSGSGILRIRISLYSSRGGLSLCTIGLLHVLCLRCFFLLERLLGLFCVEPRGREGLG